MKKTLLPLLGLLIAAPASAQMNHEDASLTAMRGMYESVRGYIIASAEQVPEDSYSFKPTPEVRSFGQLIGHVANATYLFCSPVLGEQSPSQQDAEKLTSKAELVAALKAGFAYCDRAYQIDGSKAGAPMQFFGQPHTALSILAFNVAHNNEHYGNIVTYMRLKGMVPPSSQRSGN